MSPTPQTPPHENPAGELQATPSSRLDEVFAAASAEYLGARKEDDLLLSTRALLDHIHSYRDQLVIDLAAVDSLITLMMRHLDGLRHRLKRTEVPALMGVTRAANYLGVSPSTIYNMVRRGDIPSVESRDSFARLGFLKSELDTYMATRPRRPRPPDKPRDKTRANTSETG